MRVFCLGYKNPTALTQQKINDAAILVAAAAIGSLTAEGAAAQSNTSSLASLTASITATINDQECHGCQGSNNKVQDGGGAFSGNS